MLLLWFVKGLVSGPGTSEEVEDLRAWKVLEAERLNVWNGGLNGDWGLLFDGDG